MITPFKGRFVNFDRPVQVYRNLNAKDELHRWSIRQKGLVVGHTECLQLVDVDFHVGRSGWERSLREGKRNVHAWASGMIDVDGTSLVKTVMNGKRIHYDREKGKFRHNNLKVVEASVAVFAGVCWANGVTYEAYR